MEEKKTEDIKKVQTSQDFEMGDEEVKVKHYTDDISRPESQTPAEENVDPKADPPTPHPDQSDLFKEQGKTIGQIKSTPPKGPMSPGKKKALFGCLGAFGVVMLIFLIIAFIFIGASSGDETSPLAQLLGIEQASFINGLITLIHVLFILVSLVAFTFTMIGLFRASMAKRDDKVAKKSSLKLSLISGLTLIFILIAWMFVYVYLDAKRMQMSPDYAQPIVTEPEETLNLTGPIEIKFDASNVPIDKRKFQVISYEWDFGDDETGTSQILNHTFEEKGRYDIVLTITKKDKTSGEEFEDIYSVIVSIADQALSAIFTADPQSGEAPLEVEFDAAASADPDGKITAYDWDLDEDGEYDDAEGIKATHTFDKIGIYTVSLRITNSLGDYEESEKEIKVVKAEEPTALITILEEPENFIKGVNYVFKADESTSPNGSIDAYEWDFGDGKIKTTKTVSHSFDNEGTYEITLKVTDEEDKEGEITKTITVGLPQGVPKAKITTTPQVSESDTVLTGNAPFTVTFDGSGSTDSDDNIVEYSWDFDGDGKDDDYGETATYVYKDEGTFSAMLTVEDSDGNTGTAKYSVKVEPKGIQAAVTTNKVEGTVPLKVSFDASGSSYDGGTITSYKWEFGDGTNPKFGSASITHKYTEIGTFTASVTVIGSDNSQSIMEVMITVREIGLTACLESVFEEGKAPLTTSFDPSCSTGSIASYFWDFGDSETSTSTKPTHTFTDPGQYTVTLEISDAEKNIDSSTFLITVTEE